MAVTTTCDLAVQKLQELEGFAADVYDDSDGMPLITEGVATIGYGCACRAWSGDLALAVLQWQVGAFNASLSQQPWFVGLDNARQAALITLAFNLGLRGLISGFPLMIAAIRSEDWAAVARECHVSDPKLASRYAWAANVLLTGNWE